MKKITTILAGLQSTRIANLRFTTWFNENYDTNTSAFLRSYTFQQKGMFEAFFATYNYGILVRPTGYDIYCLNANKLDKQTRDAQFLWEAINHTDISVDYYWKRHWNETVTDDHWKCSDTNKLEYFTIKVIIEVMTLINVDKKI